MRGIVTRNRSELTWSAFDRGFFELKQPAGRVAAPASEGVNLISCFGDTAAIRSHPGLAASAMDGHRATPDESDLGRGFVCPTRGDYRDRLFELIDEATRCAPDVRLDDIGFPGADYCRCEACEDAFGRSAEADRGRWRAGVITDFVSSAAHRVPGRLYVTVYPDPYPGHLRRRSGVDLDALAPHVDEFVVPLYDTVYATTYWIEAIAGGFRSRLSAPFGVELYTGDVTVDELEQASQAAGRHADHVYYGYGTGTARALVRRERADANAGIEHGCGTGR